MNTVTQPRKYSDAGFWNRIANYYSRKPVPDLQAYETKLTKTNSYLKSTDTVLEIGCGTGTTAIHHAPFVAHIRGTDISGKMIEIAKSKAQESGCENVAFEVSSIDDLTTPPASMDVILSHSILHLVTDVPGTLQRLNAMLKPGGLMICSVPCIGDFMPAFRFIGPVGRVLGVLPRVNVFKETDFNRWIGESGFTVVERWQPDPKSGVYLVTRKSPVS